MGDILVVPGKKKDTATGDILQVPAGAGGTQRPTINPATDIDWSTLKPSTFTWKDLDPSGLLKNAKDQEATENTLAVAAGVSQVLKIPYNDASRMVAPMRNIPGAFQRIMAGAQESVLSAKLNRLGLAEQAAVVAGFFNESSQMKSRIAEIEARLKEISAAQTTGALVVTKAPGYAVNTGSMQSPETQQVAAGQRAALSAQDEVARLTSERDLLMKRLPSVEAGEKTVSDLKAQIKKLQQDNAGPGKLNFAYQLGRTVNDLGESMKFGLATGGASALIGAAAGAPIAGVGALAGAAGGFVSGFGYGTTGWWMQNLAGQKYWELVDGGVDRKIAIPVSLGMGIIEGAVDRFGEMKILKAAIPGMTQAMKEVAGKVGKDLLENLATKGFKGFALETAGALATETLTENVQNVTEYLTRAIGSELQNRFGDNPAAADLVPTWEQFAQDTITTTLITPLLSGVLMAPNLTLQMAGEWSDARRENAEVTKKLAEAQGARKIADARFDGVKKIISDLSAAKEAGTQVDTLAVAKARDDISIVLTEALKAPSAENITAALEAADLMDSLESVTKEPEVVVAPTQTVVQQTLPESVRKVAEENGVDPSSIQIVTGEQTKQASQRYGIPNSIDVGYGQFGATAGSLYIDDETGKPVAYKPPSEAAVAKFKARHPEIYGAKPEVMQAKSPVRTALDSVTPQLTSKEKDLIGAVVDLRAKRLGMSSQEYAQTYFQNGIFETDPEVTRNVLKVHPGADAAVFFDSQGKAMIYAGETANARSVLHEVVHTFIPQLDSAEVDALSAHYKIDPNTGWETKHIERLTDDILDALATGRAPSAEMKSIFEKVGEMLRKFWQEIRTRIPSEEVKRVIDNLFTKPAEKPALSITPTEETMDNVVVKERGTTIVPPAGHIYYNVRSWDKWVEGTREYMKQNKVPEAIANKWIEDVQQQARLLYSLAKAHEGMFPESAEEAKGGKSEGLRMAGAWRGNIDPLYRISFDLTAMCVKRLQYQTDVSEIIKRKKLAGGDPILTIDEDLAYKQFLRAYGKTAPCLYCYVEGPRSKTAEMALQGFSRLRDPKYKLKPVNVDPKTGKQSKSKLYPFWKGALKENAPDSAIDMEYFFNADKRQQMDKDPNSFANKYPNTYSFIRMVAGGAKAKKMDLYEEYNGQLFSIFSDPAEVEKQNRGAGLRFLSSSDFQIEHVLDFMQTIADANLLNLLGHTYTKTEELPEIFKDTGLKINLSLFYMVNAQTGEMMLDKNSQPIPDKFMSYHNWERAKQLRKESPDVGTMMMVANDQGMEWALNADWIDYIIPYHRPTGLEAQAWEKFGWTDYSSVQHEKLQVWRTQNEVPAQFKGKVKKKKGGYVIDTTKLSADLQKYFRYDKKEKKWSVFIRSGDLYNYSTGTSDADAKTNYFKILDSIGARPVFEQWKDHPNYMKLKKDFARTDTPFGALRPQFNTEYATQKLKDWVQEDHTRNPDTEMVDKFMQFMQENPDDPLGAAIKLGSEMDQARQQGTLAAEGQSFASIPRRVQVRESVANNVITDGVPVTDDELSSFSGDEWADAEIETRGNLRADARSGLASGEYSSADDFIDAQQEFDVLGAEKPREYYQYMWDQAQAGRGEDLERENASFTAIMSLKESAEIFIHGLVFNEQVSAETAAELADERISVIDNGKFVRMSDKAHAKFLKKVAADPGRFRQMLSELDEDDRQLLLLDMAMAEERQPGKARPKAAFDPGAWRDRKIGDLYLPENIRETEAVRRYVDKLVRKGLRPPSAAVEYSIGQQIKALQSGVDHTSGPRAMETKRQIRRAFDIRGVYSPERESRVSPEATGSRFPGYETLPQKVKDALGQTFLRDMTVKQMEDLAEEVDKLRDVGKQMRAIKEMERKTKIQNDIKAISDEVGLPDKVPLPESKERKEMEAKGLGQKTKAKFWNMDRIAQWLGPTAHRMLSADVNTITDAELRARDKTYAPALAKMKELGITPRTLAREIKADTGETFYPSEVMHMRIALQNQDTYEYLLYGNKMIDDRGGDSRVLALVDQLTPQEIAFSEYMLDTFGGDSFERLNEAFVKDTNTSSVPVSKYFPIRSADSDSQALRQEMASDIAKKSGARQAYPKKNFMKQRKSIPPEKRGKMRLDAVGIFFAQLEKQEHYIATWEWAKHAQSVFRDKGLRERIRLQFGKDWLEEVDRFINGVADPNTLRSTDPLAKFSDLVRGNLSIAGLAGNLSSAAFNLAGPLMYLGDLGGNPMHLFSAQAQWMKNPKALWEFVTSRDPQLKNATVDPVLEEAIRKDPSLARTLKDLSIKLGFSLTTVIDRWTRLIGWKAVYDANVKEFGDAKASRMAQAATLRTQPSGAKKDLPSVYHSTWGKAFYVFSRQLNQMFGQMTSDWARMSKDEKASARAKMGFILGDIFAIALTGLFIGAVSRKRLPDNEKEVAADVASQFITPVPFVGPLISSAIQGVPSRTGIEPITGMTQLVQSGMKVAKPQSARSRINNLIDFLPAFLRVVGGPAVFVQRGIKTLRTGDPLELLGGRK